jgi:DNA-directed RNA polymerase II subunit RPB1
MALAGSCVGLESISIALADDTDIEQMSMVKVKTQESFISNETPIPGGLYDPRMGAIPQLYNCITCGHNHRDCPGHFGYYETGHVMTQPIAVDDVVKWLRIVCLRCGTLVIDPNKIKNTPKGKRLQVAGALSSEGKLCPKCKAKHPKIKPHDENAFYYVARYENRDETLYPADIKAIMEKIHDRSVRIMGRSIESHPRKYFVTNIVIPPISIRPYYKNALMNKSHRTSPVLDFTKHMIRRSNIKVGKDASVVEKTTLFMNRCIYDMIRGGSQKRGETRGTNVIGGSINDAILKELGSKKGLIRNYQMGKRPLGTARNTISGNPRLKIDEIGVPRYVIDIIQRAETVRQFNRELLHADILASRATRIYKNATKKEHGINENNQYTIVPELGDIVYRNVRHGDMINFNRNPSLKESAIGSHRAVPFKTDTENTFQMNVCVCVNYNADFDGDQMRLKVPHTLRTIAECMHITSISRWMLSSQRSSAMNGQVQDSVIGSALMTKSGVVVDKLHAMRFFANTGMTPPKFTQTSYTGREIASLLFTMYPITYRGKAQYYNEAYKDFIPYKREDYQVIIVNGVLKSGILDKSTIGDGSIGGPFHLIALEYGADVALKMVFAYQQIVLSYLEFRGFSMSLDDLILPKETRSTIDRIIYEKEFKSKQYADKLIRGRIYAPMGMTRNEYYEEQQKKILASSIDMLGPILTSIDKEENGLYNMIIFGSKGKPPNMLQTLACVGQVMIEGGRMPENFSPYRTSTFYPRYATDPKAKGFVHDPYVEGVHPESMGFCATEAREQLVQKSQSTALAGSSQRKHIKNMENILTTNTHGTTKSFMNLQYIYAENGLDGRYLIKHQLATVFLSDKSIEQEYLYKPKDGKYADLFKQEVQALLDDRNYFRDFMYELDTNGLYKYSNRMYLGIYLDNIFEQAKTVKSAPEKDLVKMRQLADAYIKDLPYLYMNDIQRRKEADVPKCVHDAVFTLGAILRVYLSTTKMLTLMTVRGLKALLDKIKAKFVASLMPPGSCAGIMAGQSVGEPMVQVMLNAIHGGSSGAKAGLERSKEVLNAKFAGPLTLSMYIRLHENVAVDKLKVQNVAEHIKRVKIGDFIVSWTVFLEDYKNPVHPMYAHEKKIIENFDKTQPAARKGVSDLSRWCIRFQLNRAALTLKSISVERIVEALYKNNTGIHIVYTPETSTEIILRIYLREELFIKVINIKTYVVETLRNQYQDTTIRGIDGILNTRVHPIESFRIAEDGSLIKSKEYVIRVVGSNVSGIAALPASAGIDHSNIHTESVMDTLEQYGIEAARVRVIEQMQASMEGNAPGYHHLAIFADTITWSGYARSIESAIKYEHDKTLSMASGYSAGRVLMDASVRGVHDKIMGVSAPVMLGNIPRVGTNYSNYLVNEEFIQANTKSVLDVLDEF